MGLVALIACASGFAFAAEEKPSRAVNAFCAKDDSPQTCEGATFDVAVESPSLASATFTVSAPTCSTIRVKIAADGKPEVVSEPIAVSGTTTTLAIDLGRMEPGPHSIRVDADGLLGGCNRGVLKSWSGVLSLSLSPAPVLAPVVVAPVVAAPSASNAPPAFATCLPCHGADGAGSAVMGAPALAGQEIWYLERQILHFRDGLRGTQMTDVYGMQMRTMALMVKDDQEARSLAAYLAALPPVSPPVTLVDGDVDRGQRLFQVCQVCHGEHAEGSEEMNAPRLTIQQDWYLARQVFNFRSNVRGYHVMDETGKQMQPMTGTIPDEQSVHDVIAYIQTLRGPAR